ncbi:hypothetical protein KP509_25G071000 [Ceratopteris richardii]|uniref:Uncharacterized protein n=1 Tax=Ceratopteris richardii TaxID=49495 RepID=A0A8T2RRF1_CERRI|nr:hypothetical protein KP509_25G071000 [Ceratopteris richardii]
MLCFPGADGTISSLSQNGSMHFPCSRSLNLSCERSNVSSEQVIKVFMSLNNKAPHYFAQAKDAVRVPCLSRSNQSAISVMCSSHEPQENTGVITRDPPECERDIPSFGVVTLDQPHMAIEERHMDEKDSFERLSSFDQRVQARADGDQQCDNELLTRDMVSLYTDRTRLVSHHEHVREPSDCGLDADNGFRRLKTGNLGNEVSSSDYIGLKYAVTRSNPPLSEMVNSVSSTNSVLELRSPRTHPDVLATAKIKYMETVNTSSTIRGLASLRMPASRPLSGMNAVGVSYLESIGVNCAKVFERVPTVKTHTLKQIKAIISALEQHGLKISEMGKIINLCPKILLLNPEKDLPKVTSFLFNEVGLPQHHFPKVVRRCPRILVADISEQLRPTLSFVRTLGFLKRSS